MLMIEPCLYYSKNSFRTRYGERLLLDKMKHKLRSQKSVSDSGISLFRRRKARAMDHVPYQNRHTKIHNKKKKQTAVQRIDLFRTALS